MNYIIIYVKKCIFINKSYLKKLTKKTKIILINNPIKNSNRSINKFIS